MYPSPDSAAYEPHLTYAAANKIVKKLSPDMVENIFKFISGEEVMRTTDIARILSYLGCKEIMRARRVSKKWRDAAKMTVPTSEFVVDSVGSYNTMRVMTTALPYLQQLSICGLGRGHKYIDGEDPFERRAQLTAHYTTHDINIISNFRKLRCLEIHDAPLNGRYPVLFNFPLLRELRITTSSFSYVKFDLGMLSAGCPSLKELTMSGSPHLTGNLRSLRVLKDTPEEVKINNCHIHQQIEGDFMDLADFPRLKVLDLYRTAVTGDVRDIGEDDFPALNSLGLPGSVYGGMYYKFQLISEVPSFMQAIHLLLQQTPTLFKEDLLRSWSLSEDSHDYYGWDDGSGCPRPPFILQFIRAGSRLGWSWFSDDFHSCEINWLDPEPSSESSGYEDYIEELQLIEGELNTDFYRGYHEPPTEMEYRRLCEGLEQRD